MSKHHLPSLSDYGNAAIGAPLAACLGKLPAQAVVYEKILTPKAVTKLKILVAGVEVAKVKLEKTDDTWHIVATA